MDPLEIPDYLAASQIKQLVGLTGLDVSNNPVHEKILVSLQNRPHDVPVNFTLWRPETDAGKVGKQAARSNKGILKQDWPLKYLHRRPGVIVLFMDLDWDHPNWPEKRSECESKVNSLR